MNKPNRFLAAVALSGAALAVAAGPAQAAGSLVPTAGALGGAPGGLFGTAAFTLAELTSGMPMPDTDKMIEDAKNSPEGQAMAKQQGQQQGH
ncbi:hypothetical protein CFP65_4390 [Kitasatospora sp. MMS16-BH015]|uniref:hypothetical protein n=1 Tax=Kitasatospora sp. MMS16-BH015 TaxID=2018025 RepID=UPI000CA32B99|nr:hypothetical protein [Kitasatospora sp. MMS16-BH015]AUG79140.1 hypothetical protein CFP65_4390 [Kitasatospora sp. MMS16-BH015]